MTVGYLLSQLEALTNSGKLSVDSDVIIDDGCDVRRGALHISINERNTLIIVIEA